MSAWVAFSLCVGASPAGELPIAVVSDEPRADPAPGVERVFVRCSGHDPVDKTGAWALVDLFAPLPDVNGNDLLEAHPGWRELSADGTELLWATPCYGLAKVRQARVKQVSSLVSRGVEGLCLSALPRDDWPAGVNVAQGFGFNSEVLAAFAQAHGGDPRRSAPGAVGRALFAALKAEGLAQLLRDVRQGHPSLRVALAFSSTDGLPHSATGAALDVPGWVAAGLVDELIVRADEPVNLLRYKLDTDEALRVWLWVPGADTAAGRSLIEAALRTVGSDGLVVESSVDPSQALARIRDARMRSEALRTQQAALRKAVSDGELVQVAGTQLEGPVDQASIHGVAQSFKVSSVVTVSAVGIVATLRGQSAEGLRPQPIEIRADEDGRPGEQVLAAATVSPSAFSREPAYQWGYARLDKPLALTPGATYWLYAPDTQERGGSYVWRTHKKDAYPGGHAWSGRYDYSHIDWVFGIFSGRE